MQAALHADRGSREARIEQIALGGCAVRNKSARLVDMRSPELPYPSNVTLTRRLFAALTTSVQGLKGLSARTPRILLIDDCKTHEVGQLEQKRARHVDEDGLRCHLFIV